MYLTSSSVIGQINVVIVAPRAKSVCWSKRIWAPNPFVVLLRKAQTDLAIRIWTILVPIRLKKPEKNGFGPFSYKFFVCIRVGLIVNDGEQDTKIDKFNLLRYLTLHNKEILYSWILYICLRVVHLAV